MSFLGRSHQAYAVFVLFEGPALLLVAGYLSRASVRRILGAVAGGLAATAGGFAEDVAAYHPGYWRYPFVGTSYGPIAFYIGGSLAVAALLLVIWRLLRAYGKRGFGVLLVAMLVLGPIRDYSVAALTGVMKFGGGALPVVLDGIAWPTLIALAVGIMWLVAGPAAKDSVRANRAPARDQESLASR